TAIVYPKEAHQLIKNAMEGMPTKEEAFETAKALIALIPSKEQALEMLKSLGEQAEPYKKQALEMVSSWIAQLPSKEQAIALGSSFSKELLEGAKKVACSTAGQLFFGSAVGSAAIQRTKKKVADANDKKEQATESIVANATSRTNSTRCLLLGGVVSSLMLNHRAIEAAVEKAPSLIEKAASIEVSSGTKFFALATAGNICFTLFRKKYTLNPNPSVKSSE
ncbi:MAG: hypothetical protein JSS09_04275, partial [Verrucomicrobia bacterium]|nr:hypothetical protein [Verrucomicrobiota bacterium]